MKLSDNGAEKILQPVLQQGAYKSDLMASIDTVRKRAQAFKDEAQQCHAQETHGQTRLLSNVNDRVEHSDHALQRILKLLETHPLFHSFGSGI